MRRRNYLTALLISVLLFGLFQPVASGETTIPASFEFVGSGYGHGVGMSQIGARGQALEGKSAVEILGYYYPGTLVTPFPDNNLIRVNIANQTTSATISSEKTIGGFTLYRGDISATENPEPFGRYDGTVTATFTNFEGRVVPFLTSPTAKFAPIAANEAWTIRWETSTVIAFKSGEMSGRYKYGQITFKSLKTQVTSYLAVTTTLRLHDEYLYGIGEVPSSWPPAALEAQVIAARTYALNKIGKIRTECDCNIYSTTVDQNFVGFAKEDEKVNRIDYGILWKNAVNRTFIDSDNALVITIEGKPINAFYFSSSGGKTQNIKEVWGSEFAYLLGVPDPWSLDPKINPRYYSWNRTVSQALMAQAFGLPNVLSYTVDAITKTNSVLAISAYSSDGRKSTLSGEVFRSRTKLPSTWIRNNLQPVVIIAVVRECQENRSYKRALCAM
ncbi:MAG: SpoIID/LytB domain-containing protein [Actinobacteria bacterium]|nr:SpoIID/LytB domain-containing protein [Actinomycetota bacterium]